MRLYNTTAAIYPKCGKYQCHLIATNKNLGKIMLSYMIKALVLKYNAIQYNDD